MKYEIWDEINNVSMGMIYDTYEEAIKEFERLMETNEWLFVEKHNDFGLDRYYDWCTFETVEKEITIYEWAESKDYMTNVFSIYSVE